MDSTATDISEHEATPARPALAFDGSQPRIMLVDDEPTILEVIGIYLEDAGYTDIVTTTEPAGAFALARESRPDVVLLDLMMPVVSGFDLLARLRAGADTRHLPVIVLTSATDPASKLRALGLGATDFLAKPVDSPELVLRVRNTLTTKAYQDRLAYCDRVTGLANRTRFIECLTGCIDAAAPDAGCMVLQLGLDRFRHVNDALGYGAGDLVLHKLGQRIQDWRHKAGVAEGGALARTGADEFSLLVAGARVDAEALRLGESLRASLAETPLLVDEQKVVVSASVGIALSPQHGGEVDALLAHAAQALSFTKRRGGDAQHLYDAEIDSWSRDRMALERDLREAVANEKVDVAFQPKVDVATGAVIGAEALARWNHPERGDVSPAIFIPIAEESGLVVPLGTAMLRNACREAATWQRPGRPPVSVAVNVSARQFQKVDLVETVADALRTSGLPPGCLTVEVTESMLMADADEAARTLMELKRLGVRISVDDFGTGYSSLSYLKRFCVDELKMDRSFITGLPVNVDDVAIATAVVAMARSLGLRVVAEGVEHKEQLALLASIGCHCFQGYLFSRAVPAAEFIALACTPMDAPRAVCGR